VMHMGYVNYPCIFICGKKETSLKGIDMLFLHNLNCQEFH
jgi:hypothetical protein